MTLNPSAIQSEGQSTACHMQRTLMAKVVLLKDIHGRMHVFECPPWRMVKVTSTLDGVSVDLSNGDGIATVKVSETPEGIGIQFRD